MITDVATTPATRADTEVLPGIHSRLKRRGPQPDQHLVDGGYTSLPHAGCCSRQSPWPRSRT
ncbi:hypothetical protein ABZW30_38925 [Kitasatospora sp. NPDC004669]|uniref:hypothetical protein n=1 Tax=Kitasatospora sp. NPDC004669 TaxID=3154555 RepID=UPI0033BEC32D